MDTGKIVKRIILVLVLVIIAGLVIYNVINSRFRYNEVGDTGNSSCNLYNEGLFCQYGDYVYFANPDDNNSLYRMKSDGSNVEKIHTDTVSHIQVVNDYIYYIRFNKTATDIVLRGNPFGIFRLEIGDTVAEQVYAGLVKSMCLSGNYIYFQAYDDENLIQLKRVKVDGTELKVISDKDYLPLTAWKDAVYFPEVEDGYFLKRMIDGRDDISTVCEGNFYMPVFVDGYIYYIDLDNDMKLSRMTVNRTDKKVLCEQRCINYNLDDEKGVVYYQIEDGDDHRLCRMNLDGTGSMTVTEGDCGNIHITKNYTYFYKLAGAESRTLYRVKNGSNSIQQVKFSQKD